MIATGCVKPDRGPRAQREAIVLVAASIALGRALLESAAALLGGGLAMLGPACANCAGRGDVLRG
jgi:hypothetical protein